MSDSTLGTETITIIDTLVDALGDNPEYTYIYGLTTQESIPTPSRDTRCGQQMQTLVETHGNKTQTVLGKLLRQRGVVRANITMRTSHGGQNRIALIKPPVPT